jgi:hypothetical protein
MAFLSTRHAIGVGNMAVIDTGIIPPNSVSTGSTTTVPTPPFYPGMVVTGTDPTFGEGEFILLNGVASTVVGDLVTYNTASFTTTRCPVTANLGQPVAVAMSANNATTSWGWYQIGGVAVVNKSTGLALGNNVALAVNSVAKVGTNASGKQILGARTANSTVSATTTVRVVLNRPHLQGRIT